MPNISIRMAETEAEFEQARDLGRAWVAWQLQAFPDRHDEILRVFEPISYAETLKDLPIIHARPKGAILLAYLDDTCVGSVMYHEMGQQVAEIKRLFVDVQGRGHGLGRKLLEAMFVAMREDGYEVVRFSSARFLTHARGLYESVGFHDIPHPEAVPKALHKVVYFMERSLK